MTTEIELMSISIGRGGISLSGGRGGYTWVPEFDLWDDFTTAEAAPLASPRTCEPGPGTLTIVDTESKLSISGGALTVAGGKATPAYGDPGIWGGAIARRAGLAMLVKYAPTDGSLQMIGWHSSAGGALDDGALWGGSYRMFGATSAPNVEAQISNGQQYAIAIVNRQTGTLPLIKGGIYTNWTLLYVDNLTNRATPYPGIANLNRTFVSDTFRVLDLTAPFNTDYGIATNRIAGSVSVGQTFVHEADCLIECVITTLPSAGQIEGRFRIEDANNYWQWTVDSTGALDLDEVVAGTPTNRGTSAGVVANGDRIVVIADTNTIRVYEANTLRITYASATNFATATAGELETLGTGGAVSDIVAWPRTLSGQAKTLLDAAFAA